MISVLCIVGPTASGKSSLAVQLGRKFYGEVVSCDSVQIYKYFNIGSAKTTYSEMQGIPHHLIDVLDPSECCNAGIWRDLSIEVVHNIHERGRIPIIVGGTGLYLKSLYLGMFDLNSRDQNIRNDLENQVKANRLEDLYEQLLDKDPVYAKKIANTDALRIIRALEAITVTKIQFSELHNYNKKPDWNWIFVQPVLSRDEVYHRIEHRAYEMLEKGLVNETLDLAEQFGKENGLFRTIGYRHALQFLDNKWTKEEMMHYLIQDTRHFAKRQLTLFRSLLQNVEIINGDVMLNKETIW